MKQKNNKQNAEFYQAKCDQYSDSVYRWLLLATALSVLFYSTDLLAFGHFELMPLIARLTCIPVLAIMILIYRKYSSYLVRSIAFLVMENYIMWSMIWALAYRSERTHAGEGFMIMNFIILIISLATPSYYALAAHILYLVNIVISHFLFNHYEGFSLMLVITIPCIIGAYASERTLEKQFRTQLETRKRLEELGHEDYTTKTYSRNILSVICSEYSTVLNIPNCRTAGVSIIEIDNLKKIIQRYGVTIADQILAKVAAMLKEVSSEEDYVIRWNSAQFMLISVNRNCAQTYEIIEKLRLNVDISKQFPSHVTLTAGISYYEGENFSEAVSKAEEALDRANNAGHNRVAVENAR